MHTLIGINGCCGRMGLRIAQLAHEDSSLKIAAALEAAGHPRQGQDFGELAGIGKLGVTVHSEVPLAQRVDVMIDFSLPAGTMAVLPTCVARKIPLVVATTGLPVASASARAAEIPMRTAVKPPGPTVTAMRSRAENSSPAPAIASTIIGNKRSACPLEIGS